MIWYFIFWNKWFTKFFKFYIFCIIFTNWNVIRNHIRNLIHYFFYKNFTKDNSDE